MRSAAGRRHELFVAPDGAVRAGGRELVAEIEVPDLRADGGLARRGESSRRAGPVDLRAGVAAG